MLTKDEEKFLLQFPSDKIVKIQPYDPKTTEIGQQIINEVHGVLPGTEVIMIGSAAARIAGQNDIDVYALAPQTEQPELLPALKGLYGEPSHVGKNFYEWNFKREGFEVEFYLSEVDHSMSRQLKVTEMMTTDQKIAKDFESIKWQYNGKPYRDYHRAKYEFYHKILED
ncbi:MAG: GrpB family protein [Candidatus Berkelbacteria bacterium]|nr:GrpB family protein [Candidatus Berkelbacteria bacterium]